jgi:hypothetical protein
MTPLGMVIVPSQKAAMKEPPFWRARLVVIRLSFQLPIAFAKV